MMTQFNNACSVCYNITNYYDKDYNKYVIVCKKHYESHKHKIIVEMKKQFHYYLINCCLILFFTVWWDLWLCLLNTVLLREFNILLTTMRLMSVENVKSVSSALQQDSKSLNELLKTTKISTHHTDRML